MLTGAPSAARAQEAKADATPLPSLDPSPQIRKAIAAMQSRQWAAARTSWEAVLELEPSNAAALSNLGKVLYQMRDYEAARERLEKATTLNPSLTDSWLTLGLVYIELKAPMRAVSAMTRGVAENPGDPRAHNSLAVVLKRIGWTNGAESEMQKALDLDPDYAEAHFNLAVMYLERKPPSLEMAGRHYRKARSLGTPPDELVEAQIRGETTFAEAEPGDDEGEESGPSEDSVANPAPAPAPVPAPGAASNKREKPKPAPSPRPVKKPSSPTRKSPSPT